MASFKNGSPDVASKLRNAVGIQTASIVDEYPIGLQLTMTSRDRREICRQTLPGQKRYSGYYARPHSGSVFPCPCARGSPWLCSERLKRKRSLLSLSPNRYAKSSIGKKHIQCPSIQYPSAKIREVSIACYRRATNKARRVYMARRGPSRKSKFLERSFEHRQAARWRIVNKKTGGLDISFRTALPCWARVPALSSRAQEARKGKDSIKDCVISAQGRHLERIR